MMNMFPIKSSYIKQIGYDGCTAKLRIQFSNGRLYEYSRVPKAIFDGLKGAESAGKYAYKNIYPLYDGVEVEDD
jgi:hypothetical protein